MTIEHISSRTNFKPSDSSAAYNEVAEEAFKLCLPYAEKRFTNGNKQSKAPKSSGENDFEKSVNILCHKYMDLFQLKDSCKKVRVQFQGSYTLFANAIAQLINKI